MWDRIEASWALRQAAASASVGAEAAPSGRPTRTGADVAAATPPMAAPRGRRAWTGRRGTAGWAAALAAAASLVLGIALGRATRDPQPGETAVPAAVTAPRTTAPEAAPPSVAGAESQPTEANDPGTLSVEAVRTAVVVAAESSVVPEGGKTARYRDAVDTPGEPAASQAGRFEPEHDYLTARHLGRAATLLTAFRTDRRTSASQQDLALWARELLVDTRMFLSLSDFGSPIEQVLLEDLELVLIQIAGLGPGAPDFEWALARESMEQRGTLARLRAASAEGET